MVGDSIDVETEVQVGDQVASVSYAGEVRKKIKSMATPDMVAQGVKMANIIGPKKLLDMVGAVGEKSPDDVFDALGDTEPETLKKPPTK